MENPTMAEIKTPQQLLELFNYGFTTELFNVRYALCTTSPNYHNRQAHAWLIDRANRISRAERQLNEPQYAAQCARHWELLRQKFFGYETPEFWNE